MPTDLVDDEFLKLNFPFPHILPDICQVVVYVLYHVFCRIPRQNLVQDVSNGCKPLIMWPIESTHCDTFFDREQYSRRFISSPLISVEVLVPSSTLIAAYFFFCRSKRRWKMPSKSISSSLYCSFTARLKSLEILSALSSSLTLVLTKTESVSP